MIWLLDGVGPLLSAKLASLLPLGPSKVNPRGTSFSSALDCPGPWVAKIHTCFPFLGVHCRLLGFHGHLEKLELLGTPHLPSRGGPPGWRKSHVIFPTPKMHYCKGNPSKLPIDFSIKFDPPFNSTPLKKLASKSQG